MLANRTLALLFVLTSALSVHAGAATSVARYGYTITQYSVMPYAVNPSTGYLRFTPMQNLAGPACSGNNTFAITPSRKFLYVPITCGEIIATKIGANGALTPIAGSPFAIGASPYQMIMTPSGKFGYVTDLTNYPQVTIIPVAANTKSGALAQLPGSVSYSATQAPEMVMDPAGKFLYVLDMNAGVYVYAVNAVTGALTAAAGSPFSTGSSNSMSLVVFPGGSLLFVTNYNLSGTISVFKVNRKTGVLTPAKGSPFPADGAPYSAAVDPARQFLYVGYYTGGSYNYMSVFRIKAGTGALTEVTGSPFSVLGTYVSAQLTTDPTGNFLYTLTESFGAGAYWEQVLSIDRGTGELTPLQTISAPLAAATIAFTTGTTAVSFTPT
jgi:6-phosphogluconolactonase